LNIVVLKAGEHQFGLVVDEVNDTQEIVVKPLHQILHHVEAFAGATILGDGKVALILNVIGLVKKAHLISAHLEEAKFEKAPEAET
jgi:two-component system, chemotaxis family, sensor kinase CheA